LFPSPDLAAGKGRRLLMSVFIVVWAFNDAIVSFSFSLSSSCTVELMGSPLGSPHTLTHTHTWIYTLTHTISINYSRMNPDWRQG